MPVCSRHTVLPATESAHDADPVHDGNGGDAYDDDLGRLHDLRGRGVWAALALGALGPSAERQSDREAPGGRNDGRDVGLVCRGFACDAPISRAAWNRGQRVRKTKAARCGICLATRMRT